MFFVINRGIMKGGNPRIFNELMDFYENNFGIDIDKINTYIHEIDVKELQEYSNLFILGQLEIFDKNYAPKRIHIKNTSELANVSELINNPLNNVKLVPWFMFDENGNYEHKKSIIYNQTTYEPISIHDEKMSDYVVSHIFRYDDCEVEFKYSTLHSLTDDEAFGVIDGFNMYLTRMTYYDGKYDITVIIESYVKLYEELRRSIDIKGLSQDDAFKNKLIENLKYIYGDSVRNIIHKLIMRDTLKELNLYEVPEIKRNLILGIECAENMKKILEKTNDYVSKPLFDDYGDEFKSMVIESFKIIYDPYRELFIDENDDHLYPNIYLLPFIYNTEIFEDVSQHGYIHKNKYFIETYVKLKNVHNICQLFNANDLNGILEIDIVTDNDVKFIKIYKDTLGLERVHDIFIRIMFKKGEPSAIQAFHDDFGERLLKAYVSANLEYFQSVTSMNVPRPISRMNDFTKFMAENYEEYKNIPEIWIKEGDNTIYDVNSETHKFEATIKGFIPLRYIHKFYGALKIPYERYFEKYVKVMYKGILNTVI